MRRETLSVAYQEIKTLREDLLRERESMDKSRSHILSPESTEEIRHLEEQELNFWRGTASKRLAGWTRDGSSEENSSWTQEAQRHSKEVEAKLRKNQTGDRERIQHERRLDGRRWLDGSLLS